MRRYSTVDAARALGVSYPTLHRWVRARCFPVPPLRRLGRISVRFWSERDLARARRYMERHYREYRRGMGRRRKLRLR
jgi:predicted site-specific integrase-resolvase